METDLLTFFNNILEDILSDFLSSGSSYYASARIIAGIGAIVGVAVTFMKIVSLHYDSNEAGKYLFKILLVSFAISFYPYLLKFINTPLDIIGNQAKSIALSEYDTSQNYFENIRNNHIRNSPVNRKYDEKIQAYASASNTEVILEEEPTGLETAASLFYDLASGNYTSFKTYIMQAVMSTLDFFGTIAFTILNGIRTFFLIVLSLFGLFSIVFSLYPTLEGSFSQWLKKYINVYLWLPIGYIMMGIINRLYRHVRIDVPTSVGDIINGDSESLMEAVSVNYMLGLVGLTSIISTIAIPTISSWMVNTSTAQMGSKVKGKAMAGADKAKKFGKEVAKAKASGGASLGASAAKAAAGTAK